VEKKRLKRKKNQKIRKNLKNNLIQTFLNELFFNTLSNEHKGGYIILFCAI
jgi:hypothetical protein